EEFLSENNAEKTFNQGQRIILIASSFDPQTLSACAWLVRNNIDLRCVEVSVLRYEDQHFLRVEQILPPPSLDDYFVGFSETPAGQQKVLGAKRQPTSLENKISVPQ